jgi:hypothetical protein
MTVAMRTAKTLNNPAVPELGSVIALTSKELKTVQYQLTGETLDQRRVAIRKFKATQPHLVGYLLLAAGVSAAQVYENALIGYFVRRLCLVLEARYGDVPSLHYDQLQEAERTAVSLLADRATFERIKKLPVILFAERGILGIRIMGGVTVTPDRNRVLLKVLTILVCFSGCRR